MKVRMYRNYDKFPYESDHHGNFNGRMIFTFFRPIGGAFGGRTSGKHTCGDN